LLEDRLVLSRFPSDSTKGRIVSRDRKPKRAIPVSEALVTVPAVPKFIEGIGEHVLQSDLKKTGTNTHPSPEVKLRGRAVSIVSNFYNKP
jgi:hypothetical protein